MQFNGQIEINVFCKYSLILNLNMFQDNIVVNTSLSQLVWNVFQTLKPKWGYIWNVFFFLINYNKFSCIQMSKGWKGLASHCILHNVSIFTILGFGLQSAARGCHWAKIPLQERHLNLRKQLRWAFAHPRPESG